MTGSSHLCLMNLLGYRTLKESVDFLTNLSLHLSGYMVLFFFSLGTGILNAPPLHQSNAFHPVESLHRLTLSVDHELNGSEQCFLGHIKTRSFLNRDIV